MIDFLKYRYWCLAVTIIFFGAGLIGYFQIGGFEYHIDFVGGTELHVAFEKPVHIDKFRKAARRKDWKDLTIQSIGMAKEGGYTEFVVRMTDTTEGLDNRFQSDMKKEIPGNKLTIPGISRVGAEVGRDIQWNSLVSVLLALLIILIYVAIRSEYRFAAGAVVAIAHDMLVVLISFLLMREQISVSVLAAILAILGYSLNDTIVIFSRVRENMKKLKGRSEDYIVNLSINQTMRRTLFTSLTTLFTVLAIYFLAGEALRGFALAMMIGIVAGTYSSVYIASPVMIAIGRRVIRSS